MSDDRTGFRQKLFESQDITPGLRAAYDKEVDAIFHETPSLKNRIPAIVLLVIALGVVAGEVRALLVHQGDFSFYVGALTMLIACAVAAAWILRDLFQSKIVKKSAHKMSEMFYGVAGILTVAALIHGMGAPSDPASTFGAVYVFVFLFVCSIWAMGNRITAAEMAVKEQLLRLECRLADLADGLKK